MFANSASFSPSLFVDFKEIDLLVLFLSHFCRRRYMERLARCSFQLGGRHCVPSLVRWFVGSLVRCSFVRSSTVI
jgi:hypothetical protein